MPSFTKWAGKPSWFLLSSVLIPLSGILVAHHLRDSASSLLLGVIRPAASEWEVTFNGFPWRLSSIQNLTVSSWLTSFSSVVGIALASDVTYSPVVHNARELVAGGDYSRDELDTGTLNESLLEHGFTLIKFPGYERFTPSYTSDRKKFEEAVRTNLLQFYPAAKEIMILNYTERAPVGEFALNVTESTTTPGDDSPKVKYLPLVHRDYNEPHSDILKYNDDEFPPSAKKRFLATDNEKIVILGIWKPNKLDGTGRRICKKSLALLSQSPTSLHPEDMKPVRATYVNPNGVHFNNRTFLSLIAHQERQVWYYYPNMTESELLILTHLDYRKEARNPRTGVFHSSFDPPVSSCDADTPRRSIETRIFVRF